MKNMKAAKADSKNKTITRFTLIELLTVISIIAILLALLMPALSYAKKIAKQSACQNHMKQLTLAFLTYAADNNGRFPTKKAAKGSWSRTKWTAIIASSMGFEVVKSGDDDELDDKFKEFLICPGDPNVPLGKRSYAPCRGKDYDNTDGIYSHEYNEEIGGITYTFPSYRLQNITAPKSTFFLMEFHYTEVGLSGTRTVSVLLNGSGEKATSVENWGGGKMHGAGQNYSFCDGHIEWMKWKPDDKLTAVHKH